MRLVQGFDNEMARSTWGVLSSWSLALALAGLIVGTANAAPAYGIALERAAGTLVTQISAGEFGKAHEAFAPEVKGKLSQSALAATWASVTSQLGQYRRQLRTSAVVSGPYTKVRVSCEFARMKMDVLVVYDKRRQVVGFFIKPPIPKAKERGRAQTPVPPFPYESTEVQYASLLGDGVFAGTLTRPKGTERVPAVLLITGSGLQDRDSTIFGHKPFAVLADHLTRAGFAVLRVDDRGTGKTTVSPKGSTIEKHAQDVAAGLAYLRAYPGVDQKRLGLVGHSEGALLAALVASRSRDVSFIVMLGGAGVSGAEINPLQVEAALRAQAAVPETSIQTIVAMQRELMVSLAGGATDAELLTQLRALQRESLKSVPDAMRSRLTKGMLEGQIKSQHEAIQSSWFRSFVATDPGPILARVRCPVLALIGEKDTQVPPAVNLKALRAAFAKGGNTRTDVRELPGLNHLFQAARTGAVSEYDAIDETFNAVALNAVTTWLLAVSKTP